MLLTTSIPDRIFRTSFLDADQDSLSSRGLQRAIRTKHGSTGRKSFSGNLFNAATSTFCMAWKTSHFTKLFNLLILSQFVVWLLLSSIDEFDVCGHGRRHFFYLSQIKMFIPDINEWSKYGEHQAECGSRLTRFRVIIRSIGSQIVKIMEYMWFAFKKREWQDFKLRQSSGN